MANVKEPFHAIRDLARQITGGHSETEVGETTPPQAPGGTNTETGKQETVDEAVDRMSGGASDDSATSSNAGKTSQSSDHQNGY
jgi:hypothetical protein